jgi:regulator of RNase E activity RraA
MPELWKRCVAVGSSTWSDTLDRMGTGPSVLDGLLHRSGSGRVAGPALTVERVNVPVTAGGVQIDPGDCIIADETGIVRVRAARLTEVLERAEELESRDRAFAQSLSAGETFSSLAARLHHS